MANVVLPHTFVPNTSAKASEVNDNFTAITNQVNGNLDATNLANNAVTEPKILDSAVTTSKINNNAVTTAKIGDTQVTNAKIASGVDAAKLTTGILPIARIADSAVTNAKLASGIDAAKLTTGTLPIARINDGDITNAKLAASGFDAGKLTVGTLPIARIDNGAVTNAKLANVATNTIKGRVAAGSGVPTDLTAANVRAIINVADGANNYVHPNHSGDVTSVGDGATTIAAGAVTNAKLADVSTNTIKGRIAAGSGAPTDLSAANVRTILNVADGANNYVHPNHTGDVTSTGDGATVIANNAVTAAKIASNVIDVSKIVVGGLVGSVVQVVVTKFSNSTTNLNDPNFIDIAGSSVTITPKSASNKILLIWNAQTVLTGGVLAPAAYVRLTDSSNNLLSGSQALIRFNTAASGSKEFESRQTLFAFENAVNTSARTYKARMAVYAFATPATSIKVLGSSTTDYDDGYFIAVEIAA